MIDPARQMENASQASGGPFHRRAVAVVRGAMSITVLVLIVAGTSVVVASALSGCGTDLFPPSDVTTETADAGIRGANDDGLPSAESAATRVRIVSLDGVFVLYDAAVPEDLPVGKPGFLAWWNDFATQRRYVFGRLVTTQLDVGQAIINLKRDLDIAPDSLVRDSFLLEAAVAEARTLPMDAARWHPATYAQAMEIMGFPAPEPTGDPAMDVLLFDGSGDQFDPGLCPAAKTRIEGVPSPGPLPGPYKPISLAIVLMARCGGLGDPECESNPCCEDPCCGDECCGAGGCCTGPCCGSTDPCCGSNDPCCGSTDRCCNGDGSCCGSSDPCCDTSDACCGDSDRCCNADNPCCGSSDPCCNANDPCCGDSNRCCNADNPCCGSSDPCCDAGDSCCGDSNRCCNPDNPCCGSIDSCCNPTDACCGDSDPCCNPDNPCCGGNSDDPCCEPESAACICDDNDACTTESIDPITELCIHTPRDCNDGDACTEDSCDLATGQCDNSDMTCNDGKSCSVDCCDPQLGCQFFPTAQPFTIQEFEGKTVCLGGTVMIPVTICNDGQCDKDFDWSFTGATSALELIPPLSGSVHVPASSCETFDDLVQVRLFRVDNGFGDPPVVILTVTSRDVPVPAGCNPERAAANPPITHTKTASLTVEEINLDVDSDNDGDIDDDFIEDESFTPQRPGKWGWTNNDDSNGDTFSDNINTVIDGAADLEDVGMMIVRNLDTSWVTNPEVRLEIANPALIRVFRSRTADATGIAGGPGLPASVDLLAELGPPVGWTLGMEGLAVGTTTLTIRLIMIIGTVGLAKKYVGQAFSRCASGSTSLAGQK